MFGSAAPSDELLSLFGSAAPNHELPGQRCSPLWQPDARDARPPTRQPTYDRRPRTTAACGDPAPSTTVALTVLVLPMCATALLDVRVPSRESHPSFPRTVYAPPATARDVRAAARAPRPGSISQRGALLSAGRARECASYEGGTQRTGTVTVRTRSPGSRLRANAPVTQPQPWAAGGSTTTTTT